MPKDISFVEEQIDRLYKLVIGHNRYGGGMWMGLFYYSMLDKIEQVEDYITGGDNDYIRIDKLLFTDTIYPIVYCGNIYEGLQILNNKIKEHKHRKDYDYLLTSGLKVILEVMEQVANEDKCVSVLTDRLKEQELEAFRMVPSYLK